MPPVLLMQSAYAALQSHVDVIATLATCVALVDGIIEIGKNIAAGFAAMSPHRRREPDEPWRSKAA